MPETPKPLQPPSHAQTLREEAGRRLSRSPHPYHRQSSEIAHGAERFPARKLRSQDTDEEEPEIQRRRYREGTNSESGTEADDEHFLKGLPAPKLRLHKGLRNLDGSLSGSASPLLSPALSDDGRVNIERKTAASVPGLEDVKARTKLLRKRNVEIIRRATEASILVFLALLLCSNPGVRELVWVWRRELWCQAATIAVLVAIYPLRVLRNIKPHDPWTRPYPLAVPASFDPAPLFYPPTIVMLVSMVLFVHNPAGLLPSIILAIASLPRNLIPSEGGLQGSNTTHWFLSCLPLLISNQPAHQGLPASDGEILILLAPLHQTLCISLHYLTTTSLLEAELQLLSIALIDILLLASSPQAVILKSLLWGGGVGLFVTCGNVLRWGVALARVPKWRFRRVASGKGSQGLSFGKLGSALLRRPENESSDDEPPAKRRTSISSPAWEESPEMNSLLGAIEESRPAQVFEDGAHVQRRHTLPGLSTQPSRAKPGRRKRATSSSVRSFFNLTQAQATVRKWIYAAYVYLCVLAIILVGIRAYVQRFALQGNEPLGWALGYLLGDVQDFRMEVVSANLQRWICLPPRSGQENQESCHLGWVEHLRHAAFGEANTRLILCAYWLGVLIVGLAIVFRLSSIYEVDTRRKVFHFMMVAMLLPSTYVDPTFAALALSLMLAIFLLLDLFRASQLPPLSKHLAYFLTPYVDGRDLKGPVVISHIFLLIGCAIPLWLSLGALPRVGRDYLAGWEVPTREVSMVSGVICVGMGDAAASLIGRRYGRRKWIWGGGKSIEGSLAFATAVCLALGLAKAWLRIGGWPANNDDRWMVTMAKSGVAAGVASLTEAVLTGGNDNVVVPVVLWLCVKGLDI